MILLWGVVFMALSIAVFFVLRFWKIKSLALTFVITHLIIVLGLTLVVCEYIYSPQIEFTWFALMFLDSPVMFLYDSFTSIIRQIFGSSKIINSVVVPCTFFIIFGSIQYYFIGRLIDFLKDRIKEGRGGSPRRDKDIL